MWRKGVAREGKREKERWCGLKTRDATNKEGGRERVVWHLVTASRLETAETCQPAANERCELDTCQRSRELRRWQAEGDGRCRRGYHSAAVGEDGSLFVWGDGNYGTGDTASS